MSHFTGKKYSHCQIVGLEYTESIYFSSMIHSYNVQERCIALKWKLETKSSNGQGSQSLLGPVLIVP